jgi:hypothetical protein
VNSISKPNVRLERSTGTFQSSFHRKFLPVCCKKALISNAVFEPSQEDFEKISEEIKDSSLKQNGGQVRETVMVEKEQ